jgi:hypothetical protein
VGQFAFFRRIPIDTAHQLRAYHHSGQRVPVWVPRVSGCETWGFRLCFFDAQKSQTEGGSPSWLCDGAAVEGAAPFDLEGCGVWLFDFSLESISIACRSPFFVVRPAAPLPYQWNLPLDSATRLPSRPAAGISQCFEIRSARPAGQLAAPHCSATIIPPWACSSVGRAPALQARPARPRSPFLLLHFQHFQQFRGICFSLEVSPETRIA